MTTYQTIILGDIWQPGAGLCSTERTFQADSDAEAIEKASTIEAGDFSSVQDTFITTTLEYCPPRDIVTPPGTTLHHHDCKRIVKGWDNEENEVAYLDTVRGQI